MIAGDISAQTKSGLEALASATTSSRIPTGFAPRDGGTGGFGTAGQGGGAEAGAGGVGGVRMAAGPPPSASGPETGGLGGGVGRWERDRELRAFDKRKVCT